MLVMGPHLGIVLISKLLVPETALNPAMPEGFGADDPRRGTGRSARVGH
jgi:hypothetical protein